METVVAHARHKREPLRLTTHFHCMYLKNLNYAEKNMAVNILETFRTEELNCLLYISAESTESPPRQSHPLLIFRHNHWFCFTCPSSNNLKLYCRCVEVGTFKNNAVHIKPKYIYMDTSAKDQLLSCGASSKVWESLQSWTILTFRSFF